MASFSIEEIRGFVHISPCPIFIEGRRPHLNYRMDSVARLKLSGDSEKRWSSGKEVHVGDQKRYRRCLPGGVGPRRLRRRPERWAAGKASSSSQGRDCRCGLPPAGVVSPDVSSQIEGNPPSLPVYSPLLSLFVPFCPLLSFVHERFGNVIPRCHACYGFLPHFFCPFCH